MSPPAAARSFRAELESGFAAQFSYQFLICMTCPSFSAASFSRGHNSIVGMYVSMYDCSPENISRTVPLFISLELNGKRLLLLQKAGLFSHSGRWAGGAPAFLAQARAQMGDRLSCSGAIRALRLLYWCRFEAPAAAEMRLWTATLMILLCSSSQPGRRCRSAAALTRIR